MKKSKVFALAGVSLLAATFLAACSGTKESKSASGEDKTYGYVYNDDPITLDYTVSSKASVHDITTNGVDGLLENDKYGNLVPSIAEDWSVSKDGLTYTYKIRKGVKWYDADGEEHGEVTAHDFVTGLKHAADKKSETLPLVQDSVKGLKDYVDGKITDFSQVGVKAVDDYTLEYTLNQPETFWNSKTTNGVLMPVNGEFLKSKGDDFGQPGDVKSILYNGPFLLKSITSKSEITFEKNENYWDKDNVHISKIKLSYYDGSDQDSLARAFSDGSYTTARLFPASSNFASVEAKYKDNIYNTQPGSGVAVFGFNIDRQAYNHTSKTSDEQKSSTKKAILNKNFRQAITFALNRENYSAQVNGKEYAKAAIRNIYTAPAFVQVNGKDFGDVVADKLQTYGDQWSGVNLADGQNGLYSKEKAKAQFEKAKAELQKEGVQFPIHLDVPVAQNSTNFVSRMQSFKQSVEDTLGKENVVVDLQMMDQDAVLNITLNVPSAADADWDLQGLVGWNPDYDDPSTYLDTLQPSSPDQTKTYLGFAGGVDNASAKAVGLDEYAKLLDDAEKETIDVVTRYEKFAAAQAWLTDSALVIPTMTSSGAATVVSKVVPFSGPSSQTGNKGSMYFKYLEVQDEPVTKKQYDEAREKWLKEKAESNKKAQQDLEKHVK